MIWSWLKRWRLKRKLKSIRHQRKKHRLIMMSTSAELVTLPEENVYIKGFGYVPRVLANAAYVIKRNIRTKHLFHITGESCHAIGVLLLAGHSSRCLKLVDVHDAIEALKEYLTCPSVRFLPSNVSDALYNTAQDTAAQITLLRELKRESPDKFAMFHFVMRILNRVASYSLYNEMNAHKLATIFVLDVICQLPGQVVSQAQADNAGRLPVLISVVESLINNIGIFTIAATSDSAISSGEQQLSRDNKTEFKARCGACLSRVQTSGYGNLQSNAVLSSTENSKESHSATTCDDAGGYSGSAPGHSANLTPKDNSVVTVRSGEPTAVARSASAELRNKFRTVVGVISPPKCKKSIKADKSKARYEKKLGKSGRTHKLGRTLVKKGYTSVKKSEEEEACEERSTTSTLPFANDEVTQEARDIRDNSDPRIHVLDNSAVLNGQIHVPNQAAGASQKQYPPCKHPGSVDHICSTCPCFECSKTPAVAGFSGRPFRIKTNVRSNGGEVTEISVEFWGQETQPVCACLARGDDEDDKIAGSQNGPGLTVSVTSTKEKDCKPKTPCVEMLSVRKCEFVRSQEASQSVPTSYDFADFFENPPDTAAPGCSGWDVQESLGNILAPNEGPLIDGISSGDESISGSGQLPSTSGICSKKAARHRTCSTTITVKSKSKRKRQKCRDRHRHRHRHGHRHSHRQGHRHRHRHGHRHRHRHGHMHGEIANVSRMITEAFRQLQSWVPPAPVVGAAREDGWYCFFQIGIGDVIILILLVTIWLFFL